VAAAPQPTPVSYIPSSYQLPAPPAAVPAEWYPPGRENAWKVIVVHHSATETGGARAFDVAHRAKGWDELGYHFVIGNGTDTPDGYIEVGSRWRKQKHGAHCKTPDNYYNDFGIGICLVGNFDNSAPTPRQMESLRKLITYLSGRYQITPERVLGHGEVKGTSTNCPGRYFPMVSLRYWLSNRGPIWASTTR
jgi:N-acetyl-anhydromuramyl-L-alanine amidase AmpD